MSNIKNSQISIVLPALNEDRAISVYLPEVLEKVNYPNAEFILIDNGSTDDTKKITESIINKDSRLKYFFEEKRGYGSACLRGIQESAGEKIVIVDADNSHDPEDIKRIINELDKSFDLVVGNRFKGKMENGSMNWLRRYFGNPILSGITRNLFKIPINDIHCGLRGFKKSLLERISLETDGMEFASELIVKSIKREAKIGEIPVSYRKRIGDSKLEPLYDGWRHLKFLLILSPLTLFIVPGLLLFAIGLISGIFLYFSKINILGQDLFVHPLFLSSILMIVGYQLTFFGIFSKVYSIVHFDEQNEFFHKLFKIITLSKVVLLGSLLLLVGVIIFIRIWISWVANDYGSLFEFKNGISALTLSVLGIQTIFSSMMLSILSIRKI